MSLLRSPYDGQILRLALPALGALAAEPLYILADTAIVGHLGREPLAALGAAATALGVLAMFNFLQYGTTAQVARATGAGEDDVARRLGAQAAWLSLGFGIALSAVFAVFAGPIVGLIGVEGRTADLGETYLRIVAIGVPSAFLALGGQGFLRGVADLRTPLLILVAGNVLNIVLELVLVYAFDLGIRGSAWGTAIAQTAMGIAFAALLLRRIPSGMRAVAVDLVVRLLELGRWVFVRTLSLVAAFFLAGAVAGRMGDAQLGAYQVSFQLWLLLALVLDALAIAGQIIVGRELGAAEAERAYAASARMIGLAVTSGAVFAVTLVLLSGTLPHAFTSDVDVLHQCALLWPVFALTQPFGGAVFALDGILIGAADGAYMAASMVLAFLVCAAALLVAHVTEAGIRGVWLALLVLILARLTLLGLRFRRRRWLVTGWAT
jgi:putative MATE family efflux protein